jgi:DNA-binding NarL/FixJ family response regulator
VAAPELTDLNAPSTVREIGKKIRVMLVDDHEMIRHGFSILLNMHPDIETVGMASDGEEAVHMARKLRPDVILMDISMPKMNGIEATRIIHSELPDICIIGLSMFDADCNATTMIEAGASIYCAKEGDINILLSVIRDKAFGFQSPRETSK